MTILIFKPLNCFSKTTSKLQMISKGITKIYKNKITSIKKKTTVSLIKIGVTKKNRKKNKRKKAGPKKKQLIYQRKRKTST